MSGCCELTSAADVGGWLLEAGEVVTVVGARHAHCGNGDVLRTLLVRFGLGSRLHQCRSPWIITSSDQVWYEHKKGLPAKRMRRMDQCLGQSWWAKEA